MPATHPKMALLMLVAVVAVAACDGVEETVGDVVEQAEDTVQLVEFCAAGARVLAAVNDQDLDAAVDAGETMVAEAPDEIAPEAETVLAAVEEARDGDPEAVQSEEFRTAADELQRYTRENCDPTS